ncbi:MAG TPA: hypothetical protein VG734_11420 [Lacunisphaera sp.]|nr:hypothetical protein [Lacunisphaera sp.]
MSSEKTSAKKESNGSKGRPKGATTWTFPKNTLEEALEIPKAIESKHGGNPMRAVDLVRAVGYKKPGDWRFQDLLKSANQYGLVTGSGATATVKLEKVGQDVVAPSSPRDRQNALLSAFRNVEDFKKVEAFYNNKPLPEDEFFENTLIREFGVPRERVETFIRVFSTNLSYLKAFKATAPTSELTVADGDGLRQIDKPQTKTVSSGDSSAGRTFLDTCFVMMPFGPWFDQYYREVYSPAIKDAGLEPVRADELFSTGTVIEQIWEQIGKAKVLLADLTGKNANVFYELGLAHAKRKPVVFTSGKLEDVPFDLRHLRVIIYDIQDPFWGEKLKINLSTYLKHARTSPDKSIPQPFRQMEKEGDSPEA